MKKIFLSYLMILTSMVAFSQAVTIKGGKGIAGSSSAAPVATATTPGLVQIGGGLTVSKDGLISTVAGTGIYGKLSTVQEFSTFYADVSAVVVTDSLQGGQFNRYTGLDSADGGMIFIDSLDRKWLRVTTGDFVNVQWYGARPFANYGPGSGGYDDMPVFRKAMMYVRTHRNRFTKLYAPAGKNSNEWYRVGTTLTLEDVHLIGDGNIRSPRSRFQVSVGIVGFYIPQITSFGDDNFVQVENFRVEHDYAGITDSLSHSFDIRPVVKFKNVLVSANGDGNGFNVNSCANPNPFNFGNADHSTFEDCQAESCINGFYLVGCDANVMLFTNCSAVSNHRWGVYDDGLLGNKYINMHFANNGKRLNVGAVYNGVYYHSIPNDNEYLNINKRPDLYPDFWYVSEPMGVVTTWDATRKYYSGGPVWNKNANANSLYIGSYTESFQPSSFLNPRTVWLEGLNGAPVVGGSLEKTFLSRKFFLAEEGLYARQLQLGSPLNGNRLIEAETTTPDAMFLKTTASRFSIKVQNSFDNNLGLHFFQKSLLLSDSIGYTFKFDRSSFGVYDPVATGLVDIGEPTIKFKNIYADGSKLSFNSTTGTATLVGGTIVVTSSEVLSTSKIYLTVKTPSGTQGFLSAIPVNGQFTINSTSATETSSVFWRVIN